jgi:glyoxylase-like metal-dependent hydrolase (beta-lactamase superfamily II)
MAFDVVTLQPNVYHLQSGANMGLVVSNGQAILIDAGLDDDAGRRIKKVLDSLEVRLGAVIITHGHADHFGGCAYLRRNLPAFPVYAPSIEAAFISNPVLEGIMLSAGALPFAELQGKFTLAPACMVDHLLMTGEQEIAGITLEVIALPGHSPNQIGIRVEEVLFTADAFLPATTLAKYPVPFTVNISQALATLGYLKGLEGTILAAGHGQHLQGEPTQVVIQANIAALSHLVEAAFMCLSSGPLNEGEITQRVCQALGDPLTGAVGYYLARATIQAALVYLLEQGRVVTLNGGRFVWAAK